MNTHHLATCLAPVLFYPAPNAARNLDPSILEPRKMTEIFKFILEIWPDERTDYAMSAGGVDQWPLTSGYHRAGSSPPILDPRYRETRHHVVDPIPHRPHRAKQSYRASSSTRSTLSGPAAPRIFSRSPPYEPRSMSFAGKTEAVSYGLEHEQRLDRSTVSCSANNRRLPQVDYQIEATAHLIFYLKEILLYLLDHFKRVTNQSEVNKMNTHHLATCLAPVLFYPAPNAARNLDPSILEPRKMTEIFKFILEIWPDERTDYAMSAGGVDQWPLTSGYHRAGSSPPILDPRYRETRHHVVDPIPHRPHRAKQSYRASSSTRSTLSGPAAPRIFSRSPPYEPRSMSFAGKTEAARSEYMGMGRSGRIKFTSLSGPTARFEPTVEFHPVHMTEGSRPSAADGVSTSTVHFPPQRKSNSQTDVVASRRMHELETEAYSTQAGEQSRRTLMHPRFQDAPTTGSTGTDSGTRSSLSTGGRFIPPATRQGSFVKKGTRPDSTRSYSQERQHYTRSPRSSRRSQPYS
ncbi:hypothetical protein AHF37_11592 [Paragonimus kellicotti]|nr:hypothetical protein AHF37_11592 [Paragonimus kellicotti]